ncbi:MAG: hypothetical protein UX39_C0008G0023 [Candidatus Magasanikbacteria bacterium GW2011_GWA2_46_17]|uniref:Peptidoglycan binding-like domain-containing protein n=1 Tax=Candidatus Magasanikbacteria bacterium GW2011_GWA2_46_17 TaxID=1619042 RepID=A0A0G1S008_9BACT|nr:MAG: hypothetical protein UX39_C0008G0023 [Candidatus Magasanikbacteria bacterium GW2011_GWA2_46_17]
MFFIFLVLPVGAFSETTSFYRSLGVGSKGHDVLLLQQFLNSDPDTMVALFGAGSPGFETDRFGPLTRVAVHKFQKKYASDILYAGQASTGGVGPKTLRKLNVLAEERRIANFVPSSLPVAVPKVTNSPPQRPQSTPTVASVYPNRVRRGDIVTVVGTNFTPVDNSVVLIDGPVNTRFDNLNSSDGQTITFVFEPPSFIKTMSEQEIRALPAEAVWQIEKPIKAANKTLTDALAPYKGIKSEAELKDALQKNGHSFDEIYNFYFVMVENSGGKYISSNALLHGLRSLPIPGLADATSGRALSTIGQFFGGIISSLFPVAHAQGGQWEGGTNTGIIMICTCGDGYLTYMTDYNGGGSGLYWFSWGFQANAGAGFISPNQLGGYETMSATCSIYVVEDCIDIDANEAKKPWGTNLF